MDLRKTITKEQVRVAEKLINRGLLGYQPFVFSDDLETGAGHEFLHGGEYSGLVYWRQKIRPTPEENPTLNRWLIEPSHKDSFSESNSRLRGLYDSFVDQISGLLGDISKLTFAEVGCNTGYFPISFCRRGAKSAVGFDRENYGDSISLLNKILGTDAQFIHAGYDGRTHSVLTAGEYDVVLSIAVLCHLSDTLQHLACLGSMARKAIFVWTPVSDEDDYCIRFGEPNKYYTTDKFPLCFDNIVRPSRKLLMKSLELMGFTEIHQLKNPPGAMPDVFFDCHAATLAIRPPAAEPPPSAQSPAMFNEGTAL